LYDIPNNTFESDESEEESSSEEDEEEVDEEEEEGAAEQHADLLENGTYVKCQVDFQAEFFTFMAGLSRFWLLFG